MLYKRDYLLGLTDEEKKEFKEVTGRDFYIKSNCIKDGGKIDMVVAKSISRFARYTLDTLKYVRMLKEKGIAVFFEDENINTLTMDGELLLGKTFTVDPISKRRLENLGEEDKFYIRDHHKPIISEEIFEEAQKILAKRNTNRNVYQEGQKRNKFSRKYAFSCMIKCGFCGGTFLVLFAAVSIIRVF